MDNKTRYKMNEAISQKRLDELQSQRDGTLEAEIAAARLLLESALQNNSGQALAIMSVLGNLVKTDRLQRIQSGELLDKQQLVKLAGEMSDILCDELQDTHPGWELTLDRISFRVAALITDAGRREAEQASLRHAIEHRVSDSMPKQARLPR